MSFIYSQALVAASSLGNCSGTAAYAPSSGSPTLNPSLWHDKTMEVSRHSRFGMTCRPLTEDHGAALLTWWLEAFPARTSAWLGKAQESRENGPACGPTWRASLAKFDPDTCSWKTVQLSLLGDSELSSVTWPRSGMTADGQCWELPTLERHISEIGSGFWPTPVASDTTMRSKPYAQGGTPLSLAVKMWATPVARDFRHPGRSRLERTGSKAGDPLPQQVGGPLNPTWVEWLMGWPLGWTALKPSETAKSPNAPQQHGESLEVTE